MRTLPMILAMGNPTPEEEIQIRAWCEEHPDTNLAGALMEKFPHVLAKQTNNGSSLRRSG